MYHLLISVLFRIFVGLERLSLVDLQLLSFTIDLDLERPLLMESLEHANYQFVTVLTLWCNNMNVYTSVDVAC